MDFELSEEQRLLKDSVERLLSEQYDFEARRKYAQEPGGFSRKLWQQYAELGLLALAFEEKYGGIGGGPVDTMIVIVRQADALRHLGLDQDGAVEDEIGAVLPVEPHAGLNLLGIG